ncbi:thymidylate synthase [Saccharopolyspora sp. NPDC047091]|uniref:thymidylate synthase n=1 Tax=Saccharopolyspora sp. NPDC047091 TaxID=3155924 RepID=UPI0033E72584
MPEFDSFADAYTSGLREVLDGGASVPSVRDPHSKASDFGQKDRPYRELIAHSFRVRDPRKSLAISSALPVNLPYCFGLLAWSLDGRNDVDTPAHYRRGAHEYSDDQHTLSGAFGHRLITAAGGDQVGAIVERIRQDPAHRRTFGLVLEPADNFRRSREYPCAVGVQLFLREDRLTWLTVMRAQQALTVLPYDGFLFMLMHQWAAALLGVEPGPYIHQSGTFHFYDNEIDLARSVTAGTVTSGSLPALPDTPEAAQAAVRELVDVERGVREAAAAGDTAALDRFADTKAEAEFADVARACLTTFAYRKLGDSTTTVDSPAATAEVRDLITAL